MDLTIVGLTENLVARLPYSLLPLDPQRKEIRLLVLSSGRPHDKLHGKLRVVSLNEFPYYEALSYTWGKSTIQPQPVIFVNGSYTLPLTDNLNSALKRLRHRFRKRVLWIDALCINQNDLAERAKQVSFMGQIYSSARRVCVWLGDVPDGSLASWLHLRITPFWILAFTYRRMRRVSPTFRDWLYKQTIARCPTAVLTFGAKAVCSALTTALLQSNPQWHTRLWVFQELNNARSVIWCFGAFEKMLEPLRFTEACRGAYRSVTTKYWTDYTAELHRFANALDDVSNQTLWTNRNEHDEGLPPTLLWNAMITQDLSSKDARDKVYALASVSRPEEALAIDTDYEKTVPQTYAEATYACIVGSGHFDVFRHVEVGGQRLEGLPSWAADFSAIPFISVGYNGERTMNVAIPSSLPKPLPNLHLSDTAESLHLNAILFDEISQSASLISGVSRQNGRSKLQERYEYIGFPSKRDLIDTLQKFCDPFRTELFGDQERKAYTAYGHYVGTRRIIPRDWNRAPDALLRLFEEILGDKNDLHDNFHTPLQLSMKWWSSYVGPTPRREDLDPRGILLWQQLHGYEGYLKGVMNRKGSVFTTSAGFLGVAATEPMKGDVVTIVYGCQLPLLLRRQANGAYTFCGLVFVGGLLSGQLENIWETNGIQTNRITLQ